MATLDDPRIPELVEDFKQFGFAVWSERGWEPNEPQYHSMDFLQAAGQPRKIFSAMRGFGKTELTALYVCWLGYCNPELSILIISATQIVANDILGLVKNLVDNTSFLKHMRPRGRAAGDKESATRFDFGHKTNFRKDSSVVARGIRSQITGLHPDVIIADDCETPENGMTEQGRNQTLAKFGEFEDILNPGGLIVVLGTPQTELSVYFHLADLEAYEMIRVPSEYPDPNNEPSMRNLAPWLEKAVGSGKVQPGQPTNPRMDELYLLEKKATQGKHRYALQMLLDPSLANEDLYPLKLSDFIVWDCTIDVAPRSMVWGTSKPLDNISVPSVVSRDTFYAPIFWSEDFIEYSDSVMYVDPSGKGKDETAAAVGKRCEGHIYVCEIFGTQGSHDDRTLLQLVQLAVKWEVKRIVVEENFGGEMYANLLQTKLQQVASDKKIAVETRRVGKTQKELRIIDIAEPLMNQHRVVLNSLVAKNDQVFLYQLCRLTRDRGSLEHDDRVDAFAGMLIELGDASLVNPEASVEKAQLKAIQEAVRSMEQGLVLRGAESPPKPKRGWGATHRPQRTRSQQRGFRAF